MTGRPRITEHGDGAMGIRGCHCGPCTDTRSRRRAEIKAQKRVKTTVRELADWEAYNGTPTRRELLEARA